MPDSTLIAAFLGSPRQTRLSAKTLLIRQGALRAFARSLSPRGLLDALPADVEAWVGAAPASTRSQRLAALRSFYLWLVDTRPGQRDPTAGEIVAAPKVAVVDGCLSYGADTHVLEMAFLGHGLAGRTARMYARIAHKTQLWMVERGCSLVEAPAPLVAAYAETLPNSFASRKALCSSLKHYWLEVGRADPPLSAIRCPPRPRMVCRALDEGPASVLAAAALARGDGKGLAVVIGLYQALRREEIATLRWDAFKDGHLTVTGKGSVTATIPVHPTLAEILEELRASGDVRGTYVFEGRFGGPVSPATIWGWVREVAAAAGLGDVSTHILRHISLATALDATGDLRAVQDFARHSDPKVTAGYTRTTGRRMKAVVDSIDYRRPPDGDDGRSTVDKARPS